jgi:hypothetical protein
MVEFKKWPKIKRVNPFNVTITEKIDGTNSCIVIEDDKIVGVQSRNRFITPEDDHFGFAQWVIDNNDELLQLGSGYHYGEWAGPGILKNPHNLEEKKLFLFNSLRWGSHNKLTPTCCSVVPVLFQGVLADYTIDSLLVDLFDREYETAEGIIVYYHAFRKYSKHTIRDTKGKWKKDKE